MENRQRVAEILKRLKKAYPGRKIALRFSSPFELLVATILSAQTTDAMVNKVTDRLFRKYRAIRQYAGTGQDEFQAEISSVNFYRNKAKNIQATARIIMERYRGEVPKTMEELIALPGIARKTANIILSDAYGIQEGIAVDTHVKRLATRLDLSTHADPNKIEQDLMAVTPKKQWSLLSHLLIFHGRDVCRAKNPDHDGCVLADICPSRDI